MFRLCLNVKIYHDSLVCKGSRYINKINNKNVLSVFIIYFPQTVMFTMVHVLIFSM